MIRKKMFSLLLFMLTFSTFIFAYPAIAEINPTLADREGAKAEEAAVLAARLIVRKTIGKDGRFIAYDDGTVVDRKSGLMWAAKDNGADITWHGAKSYCENYRGGGYTDWRMPTRDELAELFDNSKTYKACGYDVHLTELIRLTCVTPWASETREAWASAAAFGFNDGDWNWVRKSFDTHKRALPVRSGK